jgi:hypothetical protein
LPGQSSHLGNLALWYEKAGFADFLNLTNAPLRYYEGVTTRPIQEEYYRWWASFGVRMNF